MLPKVVSAALLVACFAAVPVSADPASTAAGSSFGASALALPMTDLATGVTPEVEAVGFAPAPPRRPTFEAVRYRPRPRHSTSYSSPRRQSYGAPFQIHAGFYEMDEEASPTNFVLGMRGGPMTDPHVQIAFGLDWMHNGVRARTLTGEPYMQGGVLIVPERDLARASSDLLPMTANLQINLTNDAPMIPYVGVGGGYQMLFINAEDFATGADYNATFTGWMWQAFAGLQVPLSGQARLVGEAFLHQGDASREVDDPLVGATYREIVKLDGAGMRFGLSWGF